MSDMNVTDLKERIKAAEAANERDRTVVANVLHNITIAVSGYRWATEGRGAYEWDDDRYRSEFGNALNAVLKAAEPLGKVAGDSSHCPVDPEEIAAARES